MGENKLNITAIEIDLNDSDKIKVLSIIRSTLIKDIKLAKTSISLVNREMKVISEKEEDFRALGTIKKNTAYLYSLEFPKKEIILTNFDEVKDWSLAFSNNLSHKVDYSDLDESKIPQTTRDYLQNIVDQTPLNKNELSFLGFSTKLDNENNLHLNLLIRNGTKDTLDIKQLPLKLFDATGDLTAQGSFKLDGVSILANSSKPISLVFPPKVY